MSELKLSASSRNLYAECQRAFWHRYLAKTVNDSDYVNPKYFAFGSAFHECLEVFKYSGKLMETAKIVEIAHKNRLFGEGDIGKLMASLRAYFATWFNSNVIDCEVWIETDVIKGKIDGVLRDDQGHFWILENKTSSAISPTLEIELPTDPQVCLYSASVEQLKERVRILAGEQVLGVIFRVTEKPKERLKKAETMLDYAARCKSRTFEWKAPFARIKSDEVFSSFRALLAEIKAKREPYRPDMIESFCQNKRNCVKYGAACQYYSHCHGMLYSLAKQADDSAVDF
jgi:hypothetical protein